MSSESEADNHRADQKNSGINNNQEKGSDTRCKIINSGSEEEVVETSPQISQVENKHKFATNNSK